MRLAITDLYQDRTSHIDGDADTIDAWLTVLFPEQAADVEPEEGLEELVDHINRLVQGYVLEIEPFEQMAKSELMKFQTPPKAFPNLPGSKRLIETGRKEMMVQQRPIETRSKTGINTPWQAAVQRRLHVDKIRAGRLRQGSPVADKTDFNTLAKLRAFTDEVPKNRLHRGALLGFARSAHSAPAAPSFSEAHGAYAVSRPDTVNTVMGTLRHEDLHALFNHVEMAYDKEKRTNLARNILFAIPEQFRDTIEEFASIAENSHDPEEKLARIYNYLNSHEDRERFHSNHEHGHNTRRTMSRHMKRAARFIQAISQIVDDQWLRPDVPWARYDAWGKWIHRPKRPRVVKSESEQALRKDLPPELARPTRVPPSKVGQGYKFFHIVSPHYPGAGAHKLIRKPSIPEHPMVGEDKLIPRVSLAPSVWHAIAGIGGTTMDNLKQNPMSREAHGGGVHLYHVYGIKDLPPGWNREDHWWANQDIQHLVPDAHLTGESWALHPLEMEHIGTVGGDFDSNGDYQVWVNPRHQGELREERFDPQAAYETAKSEMAKSEQALKKAPVAFDPYPSWAQSVAEEGPLDMTHISTEPVEHVSLDYGAEGLYLHHWGFNSDTPRGSHYYGRYFLTDAADMPEPGSFKPDPDAEMYPVRAMVGGNVHHNGDLEITALAVHPHHAGKGYGRTLLAKLASIHPVIRTYGTVSAQATEAFRKLKRDKRFAVKLGREGIDEPHELRLRGGPETIIKPDQTVIKKSEAQVQADLRAQQNQVQVQPVEVIHFPKKVKVVKAETDSELVRDMLGFMPQYDRLFQAARWLSGRKATEEVIRQALWDHDGDLEDAALAAHGLELSDKNRRALHEAANMLGKTLRKDEGLMLPPAVAVLDEAKATAEDVNYAIQEKQVKPIQLVGKHSGGMLVAEGKDHTYLLKPGSGGPSPAAGSAEERASQSRREAAFYHLAVLWGMDEAVPQTELITIGGREYAAIHMLGADWKNLSKVAKKDRNRVLNTLNRYREAGDLHQWAVLDMVAGNADRHGQNAMIGPGQEIKLIDHGSAFAGQHFDPAHDKKSFIPYYLRAWVEHGKFNKMDASRRRLSMPTLNHERDRELRKWVMEIDTARTREVLVRYGIDPAATLARLAKVKAVKGKMSEGINDLWVTT